LLRTFCNNHELASACVSEPVPPRQPPIDKPRMSKEEKRCATARRFSPIFGFVPEITRGCKSPRGISQHGAAPAERGCVPHAAVSRGYN
jgi:hypothetical protein